MKPYNFIVKPCLCPEGHTGRNSLLNNLDFSLTYRFNRQGKANDLDEAIFFARRSAVPMPCWTQIS